MKNTLLPCHLFLSVIFSQALVSCTEAMQNTRKAVPIDSATNVPITADTASHNQIIVETTSQAVHPDSLVAFAKTLIGIPYLSASTDPIKGFDCSGFITYVFNHFNIAVPRSSVDFTNYGKEIAFGNSRPGDLILFTGTDSASRIVGHMGIVESARGDTLYFIHSTSGKAKGVVVTPFGNYYASRFVKVVRVFPDELFK